MIAGFDLGGVTGVAVLTESGNRVYSSVIDLGKKRSRATLSHFHFRICEIFLEHAITRVAYEQIRQKHRSNAAAIAYGGYESILWVASYDYNLPLMPINAAKIKSEFDINPLDKEDVELAAMAQFGGYMPYDHNEADALLVAKYACNHGTEDTII